MNYIKSVTGMKLRTIRVVTKWQQNNFLLLKYYSVVKQPPFNEILEVLLHRI